MKLEIKEEEIVCKFYLSYQNNWRANIDVVCTSQQKEDDFRGVQMYRPCH